VNSRSRQAPPPDVPATVAAVPRAVAAVPPAALATGPDGWSRLLALTATAFAGAARGERDRGGPLPAGGPLGWSAGSAASGGYPGPAGAVLPETGVGADRALETVSGYLARGAADPGDPRCAAHLHAPPLAVAVAIDAVVSALNPSMDSWDQAPAATALEQAVTDVVARLVVPAAPVADALVTTGGTESNLLALLLAREDARRRGAATVQVVRGANAHHSIDRAAWTLDLPRPVVVADRDGVLRAGDVARVAGSVHPLLVVATAGTTDRGAIDPLPELAAFVAGRAASLHVDAAYGGPALLSADRCGLLAGIDQAATVTLDFHKLGWQPLAAGMLAVRDRDLLRPLSVRADYLNADDDIEAGMPDLLGRSLRTSRRPDVAKLAVSLLALGRSGMADLVDRCCGLADLLADVLAADPDFRILGRPTLSTVVFRPVAADRAGEPAGSALVAAARRRLLDDGVAVVGRTSVRDGGTTRVWLKLTLLNPNTTLEDLGTLVAHIRRAARPHGGP
jgi:L-2,4-diaminobutyrate decarboxylase